VTLTDTQFIQVQHLLRAIWSHYSDEYGYRSEKIARVDAASIEDAYALVQMLDMKNRRALYKLTSVLKISWPEEWDELIPLLGQMRISTDA